MVPLEENNTLGLRCKGTEYLVREFGAIPIKSKDDYETILNEIKNQKDYLMSL